MTCTKITFVNHIKENIVQVDASDEVLAVHYTLKCKAEIYY